MNLFEPTSLQELRSGPNAEAFANLGAVDWSFTDRAKAPEIERIHPYPAKFIGDIPRALIEYLSPPAGTKIFDPFCGSGTTLVEAQRAGYQSVGIDLNPIGCLISRVKTASLAPGLGKAVAELIERAKASKPGQLPKIPNVDHWFKRDVQIVCSALANELLDPTYLPWRDALRLALSSILVRVSNQESDTRYAAIEKNNRGEDVYSAFAASAAKLEYALNARAWTLSSARVIEGDTLQATPQEVGEKVGLVVTSPPYPNAYEYWLYHKYRMWWLGFDPLAVKEREIGARAHFFKKNHHTAGLFVDQMRTTFRLIESVLVPQGYVCFVVGRSKIHGAIIDNAEIITQLGTEMSMKFVGRFERVISSTRKSFNLSHANIKTESIIVLQKP